MILGRPGYNLKSYTNIAGRRRYETHFQTIFCDCRREKYREESHSGSFFEALIKFMAVSKTEKSKGVKAANSWLSRNADPDFTQVY